MKKTKFNIQGMTCSSCSAHVEKAVKSLDGIINANVNLLSNSMSVEYDEKIMDNDKIIKTVTDAGYGANIDNKDNTEKKTENKKIDNKNDIKSMKNRLIISICFLIPLMYIAMYHMLYDWFKIPIPQIINNIFHGAKNSITFSFTQLLLVLPIIYVNRNYFIVGYKRLLKKAPNMDSLIAIGSTAAIVYGIFAIYMIGYGLGQGNQELIEKYTKDIYFESAGTILTLITLGKYLETKSKAKTSDAISKLVNLAPKIVTVIRQNEEVKINLEEVVKDDIIVVKPGESIGIDGIIIEGQTFIDQASITGESIPVEKKIGDTVISGTINKNGYFKMKASKVGEDTTLSQIIKLVEEASNSKAPISKIADKVSGIFVPVVITISILSFLFWILNGQSFEFALSIAISVLVISCPCALGLATPVAIMVGTGKAASLGILVKSAESLEMLHLIDTVVLDKTGTITVGKPKITDIVSKVEQNELLKIVGSLEEKSEHPLAQAVMEKIKKDNLEIVKVEDFTTISGRGVQGKIENTQYFCGNLAYLEENNINTKEIIKESKAFLEDGKTVLYCASDKEIIGIIAVADTIKESSYKMVNELRKRNIQIAMITGDNKTVANTIAKQLNIDKVISEVLPIDKEKEVAKLQKEGKKVAFVGDGINDSPALARADVGIAIGSGTDIAIESADIVLMKDNLQDVVSAILLGKAVIRNIKMNLFWAFFYNCIGIPIACGIFYLSYGLKLNPMFGAAAMSLSSVCVVTNALRLRGFKVNFKEDKRIMNIKTIFIEGMQCNHCKMSVEKALNEIQEITKAEVNLENKTATIEFQNEVSDDKIKKAIEEAGFEVKQIK